MSRPDDYPLARLLRIRILREESARTAVALCRKRLLEAEQQTATAEELWTTCRRQRPEREAALFETIRGTIMEQRGMDRYHADRAALVTQELELEDLFRKAQKKEEEARNNLERAFVVLQTANQKVRKFEEHRSLWQKEEHIRQELAEEQEQEN